MSTDFAQSVNRLAAHVPLPALAHHQVAAVDAGRGLADEFIEAARAGALPPDGLLFAIRLVGYSGPQRDLVMRGFLQDLQKQIAGVA